MNASDNTRTRRWLLATAATISLAAILGMGGCAYFKDWQQLPAGKTDERTVYIISHGWHTGIVVAREQLGQHLQFVPTDLGENKYYEFGWGEKDFYQAPKNTLGLALKAAFWKNDAVMHVVAIPDDPLQAFPDSTGVELHVSSEGLRQLTDTIATFFKPDANGEIKSTRDGLYGHSRFFEANGSYYLFNTCNTWSAEILAEAGVPTTKVLTITAGSVMRQSKRAASKYECCPPNVDAR
ncbi:MAG TPA: DUF2459 domain-containing protein [Steroidobacteraceae bacterium]|nr:DUF2459 domain-containing protein [Steroidobacteraceae bacterium]